ncbi:hypothetical protein [Actinospica robiniae]|uniref:Uncharacterized protein n=1 Tax=Actinospica robiniae DSM 44927 TaxID=479430 RepID=W9E4K1_9ACTN|nr:hypothetical protein [Actinospica robiniae]ETA71127.1 hypothetical protein ActroDRAFT_0153 [Actinospica robiniae DSM 44927]
MATDRPSGQAGPANLHADGYAPDAPSRPLIPRWCSVLLLALGAVTLPWTAGLAVVLPSSERTAHYDVSWAGFDLMLCALLLYTGWNTLRRREQSELSAAMTGTLLIVDAWFDVLGAPDTDQFLTALAMALLVELPLAGFCFWITKHVDAVRVQRESALSHSLRRVAQRTHSALKPHSASADDGHGPAAAKSGTRQKSESARRRER